jgi:hypothetical protein
LELKSELPGWLLGVTSLPAREMDKQHRPSRFGCGRRQTPCHELRIEGVSTDDDEVH